MNNKEKIVGIRPNNFKTPCYKCLRLTLNVNWWVDDIGTKQRLYCHFCHLTFPYFDLVNDSKEVQEEMEKACTIYRKRNE